MQIEQLLKQDATIIDVRTPMEFSMGNVEGSLNIPLGEIMMHVDELREMQKPIILVCASGNRSGQAAMYLKQNGISDVFNGGAWSNIQFYQAQLTK